MPSCALSVFRTILRITIAWGCLGQTCAPPTVDAPDPALIPAFNPIVEAAQDDGGAPDTTTTADAIHPVSLSGSETSTSTIAATVAKPVLAVGLSPRSFDGAGFVDAFGKAAAISGIGVVQVNFAWDRYRGLTDYPSYTSAYDWMIAPIFPNGANIFDHHGLKRAFWLSFTDPARAERLNLPDGANQAGFAGTAIASAYVAECVWFADHFKPDYLAIGVEIDSYVAASSAAERTALLSAIGSARSAIKAAHPTTVVFVYFQYENVVQKNLWSKIRPFASASDVYAFSTYPSMPKGTPNTGRTASTLPTTYYAAITANLGSSKPVAFAEFGHPSSASSFFTWGSPQEQADMIGRFFATMPTTTSFAAWTYLHDLDMSSVYAPDVNAYFGTMGLLRPAAPDTPTPAWTAWLSRNAGS